MKKVFYKIVSILMSLVVLLSTMSFTVNMHYCGTTLVDTAILTKVKKCGMDMQIPSSNDCSVIKKNCCSDKQKFIDGQDDLRITFNSLTFEEQVFITSLFYIRFNLFSEERDTTILIKEYSPPLVVKDIQKLDEVYII